jgi:hypothetical protein
MLAHLIFSGVMACCAKGATNTASWSQWHGPDRTGTITDVSGWPQGWPPKELWRTNGGRVLSIVAMGVVCNESRRKSTACGPEPGLPTPRRNYLMSAGVEEIVMVSEAGELRCSVGLQGWVFG